MYTSDPLYQNKNMKIEHVASVYACFSSYIKTGPIQSVQKKSDKTCEV